MEARELTPNHKAIGELSQAHMMRPAKPVLLSRNHKAIGEHSEAVIRAKLVEIGYGVFIPLGDNLRCDLLIEDVEGNFWRVQCKTGWLGNEGAFIDFATASSYYHTRAGKTGHGRKGYQEEIDYFAVYYPDTRGVYLVPIDHMPSANARLRLVPTANGQEKHVRWAKEYEL